MNSKPYFFVSGCILAVLSISACGKQQNTQANAGIYQTQNSNTPSNAACANNVFLMNTPPQINQAQLSQNTQKLCFEEFSLEHSATSKGPLWVAEHLTLKKVTTKIKRQGEFHFEERIPKGQRAELSDYKGSGFDRGHMAASSNMSTVSAQQDSFSLANMIPQNPQNNQNAWRNLEEATRALVSKSKQSAYIVTGVAFLNKKVTTIGKNRVLVPSHVYKAVYQPDTGVVSAYWIANTASAKPESISLCALEEKTGVNVFPMLSKEIRRQVYALPTSQADVPNKGALKRTGTDSSSQCSNKITDSEAKKLAQNFH